MTKKQIKAMQDIISDLQYRRDASIDAQNEKRAEKNEPPLPREIVGEQKTPTGYMVLDGCVGVYYHEPVAELPHDDKYDRADDILRREISDQLENGDYCLVSFPFSGDIKASKIREILKQYGESIKLDRGRTVIDLQAKTERGETLESRFNVLYVRRAVEALGGSVRLYIGKHRVKAQPYPFLIVVQEDTDFNLDRGTYAIVMPMRR